MADATINSSSEAATSKTAQIKKANVDFGAQNDTHVVNHGSDAAGARLVNVYDSSNLRIDGDAAKITVEKTSDTTTTIKNTVAGANNGVTIAIVIPAT